jgi:hypothetical protein
MTFLSPPYATSPVAGLMTAALYWYSGRSGSAARADCAAAAVCGEVRVRTGQPGIDGQAFDIRHYPPSHPDDIMLRATSFWNTRATSSESENPKEGYDDAISSETPLQHRTARDRATGFSDPVVVIQHGIRTTEDAPARGDRAAATTQ